MAYTLWQNKQYPEARQHFLQSSDGEVGEQRGLESTINCQSSQGCGSMLVEFHLTSGYSSELDLFIAQTVLQYLCLKKSIAASTAFLVCIVCINFSGYKGVHWQAYTTEHPRIGSGPPYPNPLLNFIWFLLLSIQVTCFIRQMVTNLIFSDQPEPLGLFNTL